MVSEESKKVAREWQPMLLHRLTADTFWVLQDIKIISKTVIKNILSTVSVSLFVEYLCTYHRF